MYRKKTVIMIAMIAAVMLMALGYAAFATRLNINTTGNITSTWNVYFSNITEGVIVGTASNNTPPSVSGTTAYFDMNLRLPGESITYEVTLTNGGTVGAIISDIKAEAEGSSAIMYSISGLKVGDKLAGGASKTITVKTEYADVMDQPSVTSKTLVITIDAVQDVGQTITQSTPSVEQVTQLRSAILKNNIAYADNVSSPYVTNSTGIDFSKPSSDTNGKGLYYTSTNTEGRGTSYYFRGKVENNYVKFGGEYGCVYNGQVVPNPGGWDITSSSGCGGICVGATSTTYTNATYAGADESYCESLGGTWTGENGTWQKVDNSITWKIVRINEDGTIRLALNSVANGPSNMFNKARDDNAYLGYMYGDLGSNNYKDTHKNIQDSTIKKSLDNWYVNNLSTHSKYIADSGFCNDRSLYKGVGYGNNSTTYSASNRIGVNNIPQFKCPQTNDLFTVDNKGNRALIYPIGLLSLDEVVYAGASHSGSNTTFYLYDDYNGWYTMTPSKLINDGSSFYNGIFVVNMDGYIDIIPTDISYGNARPVINLKSDIGITGGDGTVNNPYVISLD